ncbi:MAG TPA: outer membrane beta-barrel protein [Candidatus Binatia bacterium]|nr:outer membrane beta-barrel protein [Candidatus Binatia bacterium]
MAKTLTASAGIVTGWDNPRDNNNSPSGLAGINFTPMDSFALASNVIFGPEQTHNTSRPRFTWSNVATIKPADPLSLLLEYTLGREDRAPTPTGLEDAWWHAFAGIASYAWTDRFTTALRGEVFLDSDAARTFGLAALRPLNDVSLAEVTLTGGYKFTKMLLGRAEVRQDWSDERVYQRGRANADKNQTTVGLQLIYQY